MNIKRSYFSPSVSGFMLLGLLVGCGGATAGRYPVYGTVTFDGQQVTDGAISIVPVAGTDGSTTGGSIVNGKYSIAADKGAKPGRYRVEIFWPREEGTVELYPGESGAKFEESIPARYNTKSTLEIQIDEGKSEHNFELTTAG